MNVKGKDSQNARQYKIRRQSMALRARNWEPWVTGGDNGGGGRPALLGDLTSLIKTRKRAG